MEEENAYFVYSARQKQNLSKDYIDFNKVLLRLVSEFRECRSGYYRRGAYIPKQITPSVVTSDSCTRSTIIGINIGVIVVTVHLLPAPSTPSGIGRVVWAGSTLRERTSESVPNEVQNAT